MSKPVISEIKFLVSSILNEKDTSLRQRVLKDVMDLLSQIEMDFTIAEEALKAELAGDKSKSDHLIEEILKKVDELENKDSEELDKTHTNYADD